MGAQPMIPVEWSLSDGVRLPPGAEVMTRLGCHGRQFVLVADGNVCSKIDIPNGGSWIGQFLESLGKAAAAEFCLADWIEELDVTPDVFCETINVLYQCGFVCPLALPATAPVDLRKTSG